MCWNHHNSWDFDGSYKILNYYGNRFCSSFSKPFLSCDGLHPSASVSTHMLCTVTTTAAIVDETAKLFHSTVYMLECRDITKIAATDCLQAQHRNYSADSDESICSKLVCIRTVHS